MIGLYTKFTTSAENRPKFVEILQEAASGLDSSLGCKLYEVALDATDPTVTVVTEVWEGEEAHTASLQLPESKSLIAKAMPLLTGAPKQIKLGPVISSWIE